MSRFSRNFFFLAVASFPLASIGDPVGGGLAEESIELTRFGVAFRPPRDWFTPESGKIVENIRKLDREKEDVRAFLASHRGSIVVASYLKYDPRTHEGLIPTINILARPNPHRSFEEFRKAVAASERSISSVLRNYVVTKELTERKLGAKRVVFFVAEYNISTTSGVTSRVSGTTYAIPLGDIFLQVSMSEALALGHVDIFARFIDSFTFKNP